MLRSLDATVPRMSLRASHESPDRKRDRVIVRDLRARGVIGVDPDERTAEQEILLQLVLETDTRPAAASDDIADALDYRALTEAVRAYVASARPFLVEKLAAGIARICVVGFGADRACVRVEKPGVLPGVGAVGVEIERGRADFSDP